jgi:hypothetical protein
LIGGATAWRVIVSNIVWLNRTSIDHFLQLAFLPSVEEVHMEVGCTVTKLVPPIRTPVVVDTNKQLDLGKAVIEADGTLTRNRPVQGVGHMVLVVVIISKLDSVPAGGHRCDSEGVGGGGGI